MSKGIKLKPEEILKITEEFQRMLSLGIADGRISYSKTFASVKRRATIFFSDMAWAKMHALIKHFDSEVAWHGVAYRGEDESKDEYYITDILVYPQTVTGATVDMDEDLYARWICDNYDDDRFYNIRMQGHSHVNMNVSPSQTDLDHQKELLSQLNDNMFYIFMIWNKSGANNTRIYDMKKNILFEPSDIDIVIAGDFINEAKEVVKERRYTYNTSTYNTNYVTTQNNKKEENKVVGFQKTSGKSEKKSGMRKGKRRDGNKQQKTQTNEDNGGYEHLSAAYYYGHDYPCY